MKKKHRRTLDRIFEDPVRSDIRWTDVEALIEALGGRIVQRSGSRVSFVLNHKVAVFHRPHPRPNADKGSLKSVRAFLMKAGIEPWQT
ncbi:MAG: type II toxin-antitoxin system HicA family toxin [bacterium]